MSPTKPNYSVVFDLGNVLIDWNPRHLYKKMFGDDHERMEWFLANICTMSWNSTLDAGASFAKATQQLADQHPEWREYILAYDARWMEMITGAIDGTVEIFRELKAAKVPCYALSNWSDEKFQSTHVNYEFFKWFDGMVISGQIGMIKPDRRIYQHLLDKFALDPRRTIFIDDLTKNIDAAEASGMHGIVFATPEELRARLAGFDILPTGGIR